MGMHPTSKKSGSQNKLCKLALLESIIPLAARSPPTIGMADTDFSRRLKIQYRTGSHAFNIMMNMPDTKNIRLMLVIF